MTLSNISSSNRLSDPVTNSRPLSIEAPIQQAQATGATGDKRLLELYASAIRQATQTNTGDETIDDIPNDSRFGAWWQQLYNVTHSPAFLEWAKSKNIDTSQAITVNPHSDVLTVTINGERTELRGSEQGPGWREATGPIMVAVKALGASIVDAPTRPQQAPLILIARFYGEVLLPYRKEEVLSRATQLEHNQEFDVLGADTYVDLVAQSPEILEQQKRELGDSVNKFALLEKMKKFSQAHPEFLARYLADARVSTHPDSTYRQETQQTDASLQDLLHANGWHVPNNVDELKNLIHVLGSPALPQTTDGNFAGALAWPMPMSIEDQSELVRIVIDNQPPLPGLSSDARLGSADVLGALVKQVPRPVLNQGDPVATVQWILNSGLGQELGIELKKRMGQVAQHSTPREVLLTVLAVTLDSQSLVEAKPDHIAGFNLTAPEFNNQPLSVIKQGLIDHLLQTNKTTPEAAPIATMLLLSRAAPELCVKDIPADVTYLSANWLNLKAAVGRIEATSPGAAIRMSFSEIVNFDAIDPITDHEQEIQTLTAWPGIREWGKAHGKLSITKEPTAEQLEETQKAFRQEQQQILSAADVLTSSPPTQRSIALAELKAHFGEGIPFEEKSIRSHVTQTDGYRLTPSLTLDPEGSYSLLDLFLAKKAGLTVGWYSTNPKITETVINQLLTMPDPITKHSQAFDQYAEDLSQAWSTVTKKLISNLPLEDRKNIEWGDLEIYEKGQTTRTETLAGRGGTLHHSDGFSRHQEDRSLIIKTVRNGVETYYEFDPQRKELRKRDDWKNSFHEGPQGTETEIQYGGLGKKFTVDTIQKHPASDDAAHVRGVPDNEDFLPDSFSSDRSNFLGMLLSKNIIGSYAMEDVKASTREVTTFDQEKEKQEFFRNLVLGLIPGGSALWNLAHGNYKDAAADIIFDIVLYATTAGLGKAGSGAARAGSSRFGKYLTAGKSTAGVGNLFRSTTNGGEGLLSKSRQWFGRLTGASDSVDLLKLSNRHDIAIGTYKPVNGAPISNVAAKFDEATGRWLPYDVTKNKVYGNPLENFTPETARYFEDSVGTADDVADGVGEVVRRRKKTNHLEKSLANDNALHLGREIKDFKVLGDGIFCYVDKYKGVERLNICAHGVNPNFKQLLTDEPMSMFFNGKKNTPADLLEHLRASGISPEKFNNVRLLMCHSANGSANSFGSHFGKLIKRDVKAFQGPVRAYVVPEDVGTLKENINLTSPGASAADINQRIYNQLQLNLSLGTSKTGPKGISGSRSGKEIPFYYRPVKFKAS